jgi:hypothetical protein
MAALFTPKVSSAWVPCAKRFISVKLKSER